MTKASEDRAVFFVIANVVAGILHFFFQIWSSTRLSVTGFGEFNSWNAYFALIFSIGSFAQYEANFFIASKAWLRRASLVAVLVSLVSLFGPWLITDATGLEVALVGGTLGVLYCWFVGQAQARFAFTIMGLAVLSMSAGKFAFAWIQFPVPSPSVEMAWAVALSYVPALIVLSVSMLAVAPRWKPIEREVSGIGARIIASAILSFATVLIPQIDIIAIHWTQAPEATGHFAFVSLIYKAVFFTLLILAQWLLPYQLSRDHLAPPLVTWVSRGRWRILSVSLLLGLVAYVVSLRVGPYFSADLEGRWQWLGLSSLNMVILSNLFFAIQVFCVRRQLKRAGLILAALVVELGLAIFLHFSIDRYLISVCAANALIWLVLAEDPNPLRARRVFAI